MTTPENTPSKNKVRKARDGITGQQNTLDLMKQTRTVLQTLLPICATQWSPVDPTQIIFRAPATLSGSMEDFVRKNVGELRDTERKQVLEELQKYQDRFPGLADIVKDAVEKKPIAEGTRRSAEEILALVYVRFKNSNVPSAVKFALRTLLPYVKADVHEDGHGVSLTFPPAYPLTVLEKAREQLLSVDEDALRDPHHVVPERWMLELRTIRNTENFKMIDAAHDLASIPAFGHVDTVPDDTVLEEGVRGSAGVFLIDETEALRSFHSLKDVRERLRDLKHECCAPFRELLRFCAETPITQCATQPEALDEIAFMARQTQEGFEFSQELGMHIEDAALHLWKELEQITAMRWPGRNAAEQVDIHEEEVHFRAFMHYLCIISQLIFTAGRSFARSHRYTRFGLVPRSGYLVNRSVFEALLHSFFKRRYPVFTEEIPDDLERSGHESYVELDRRRHEREWPIAQMITRVLSSVVEKGDEAENLPEGSWERDIALEIRDQVPFCLEGFRNYYNLTNLARRTLEKKLRKAKTDPLRITGPTPRALHAFLALEEENNALRLAKTAGYLPGGVPALFTSYESDKSRRSMTFTPYIGGKPSHVEDCFIPLSEIYGEDTRVVRIGARQHTLIAAELLNIWKDSCEGLYLNTQCWPALEQDDIARPRALPLMTLASMKGKTIEGLASYFLLQRDVAAGFLQEGEYENVPALPEMSMKTPGIEDTVATREEACLKFLETLFKPEVTGITDAVALLCDAKESLLEENGNGNGGNGEREQREGDLQTIRAFIHRKRMWKLDDAKVVLEFVGVRITPSEDGAPHGRVTGPRASTLPGHVREGHHSEALASAILKEGQVRSNMLFYWIETYGDIHPLAEAIENRDPQVMRL